MGCPHAVYLSLGQEQESERLGKDDRPWRLHFPRQTASKTYSRSKGTRKEHQKESQMDRVFEASAARDTLQAAIAES